MDDRPSPLEIVRAPSFDIEGLEAAPHGFEPKLKLVDRVSWERRFGPRATPRFGNW